MVELGALGGQRRWAVIIIAILVLTGIFVTYNWLIPRPDLEIRTVYHETPGGGGTAGIMHVNILLTNEGNREITSLICAYRVSRVGGGEVANHIPGVNELEPGKNVELKLDFLGSQFWDYRIDIDIEFDCSGSSYGRSYTLYTEEDAMNLVFVEYIP